MPHSPPSCAAALPHPPSPLLTLPASHDSLAAYQLGNLSLHDLVAPPDHRPQLAATSPHHSTSHHDSLPVVDFSAFAFAAADEPLQRKETLQVMREAAQERGFFRLVNHNVPMDLISRIEGHVDRFFTLPLEAKVKGSRTLDCPFGYAGGSYPEHKIKWWAEALHVPWDREANNLKKTLQKVCPHEEAYNDFCADVAHYMEYMQTLGHRLRELLTECLGLPPSYYNKFYEGENTSAMRFAYYPPCPQPESMVGIHGHTDPGTITILHQDSIGGLQILENGKWVGVKPVSGSLIINLGDCFQIFSNGRFKSALHRVVLNRHVARRSLVFFYHAKVDAILEPAMELVNPGPALYGPTTWDKYRNGFLLSLTKGEPAIEYIKVPSPHDSQEPCTPPCA